MRQFYNEMSGKFETYKVGHTVHISHFNSLTLNKLGIQFGEKMLNMTKLSTKIIYFYVCLYLQFSLLLHFGYVRYIEKYLVIHSLTFMPHLN